MIYKENVAIKCKYYEQGTTEDFCGAVFNCADIRMRHGGISCNYGILDLDWVKYILLKGIFDEKG